ncbi:hypothetical protein QYF52_11885 [Paenibacillus polymyxa]|uniref:hypothetical protein n=1 Tax=Paenibacillus polymyxa TaxID=1406 RepID=UPI0008B6AD1D|nr:hypothetical protein [Paenibacillus polymyxa]MDN4078639.1 hypothetical protein [Paenibacillus polymyxa]MDN4081995.1 hypothetical protein [Paenibacillus polymyxa]MDN4087873.1 hypothetical protein [Paenibacillus polymyxa]MDN4104060.1 hypothetical protein [Paenibacillus polymyxa]MDN4107326.1 hypothetical protein [Paenibacillus polymyxa]
MRNSDSLSGFPLLHDYQLEEMWRTPQSIHQSQRKRGREGWNWRQRVQYAVGHALNEYFGMEVEVRREVPVQYVLEKWWPKQSNSFESLFHYWDVKNKVSGELSKICALNNDLLVPVMLYEQFCTAVPELEVDISLIIQAAWQQSEQADSLLIQKYMVDYNPNVISTFHHLTNVFCYYAFGALPQLIEVYCLLEGKKVRFLPGSASLQQSLDYVRLLKDSREDMHGMAERCRCRGCMGQQASQQNRANKDKKEEREAKNCRDRSVGSTLFS